VVFRGKRPGVNRPHYLVVWEGGQSTFEFEKKLAADSGRVSDNSMNGDGFDSPSSSKALATIEQPTSESVQSARTGGKGDRAVAGGYSTLAVLDS
jgi:hypothetical protein